MEKNIDSIFLLKKNIEELLEEKNSLHKDWIEISNQRKLLFNTELDLETNIKRINKEIMTITEKMKQLEEEELTKQCHCELLHLDSPLSSQEMHIIVKNMDKKDYRDFGDYPRWIDLQKITDFVVEIKQQYHDWILIHIERLSIQTVNIPPNHKYIYGFNDGQGRYFTVNTDFFDNY